MKSTILLLAFLTIVSIPAFGTAWFNITNAYIQQLDEDSYRLRVYVDYDVNLPIWSGDDYPAHFTDFRMSLLGTSQFNATLNSMDGVVPINNPGEWVIGCANSSLHSPEFGYDFDATAPLSGSYAIDYSALFLSTGWIEAFSGEVVYSTETFTGTFTANVVPEPTTILLVGFGLVGAGIVRRIRNRNI